MPDLDVALRLRADGSGLVGEVRKARRELDRLAREAERAARREREAFEDSRSGIEQGLGRYADDALDATDEIERATRRAFGGMEDAIVEFTRTGRLSFRGLVDSILADLVRISVRQSITGPLAAALGSAFGGGGGGGLGGGSFAGSQGLAHTGAVIGQLGGVRRHGVDPAMFAGAPRLHAGGIAGGEVPAILRRGEGVFTPEQMRALGPVGDIHVDIAVENTGTPQRYERRGVTAEEGRVSIRLVAADIDAGGDVWRAMRGRLDGSAGERF